MDDLNISYSQLITGGTPRFFADNPFNIKGAFLSQALGLVPNLFRDLALNNHTLNITRTIAKLQELNLPARTLVVHPSTQGHRLPDVITYLTNHCFDRHVISLL
ncbi:hypothetical protein D3C81_1395610 [compost metagenome]